MERQKRKKSHKGMALIICGLFFVAFGIGFIIFSVVQMRSYQHYILAMAYDFENPGVTNKAKYEDKNLKISQQNLKALEYHLSNDVHQLLVPGIKLGDSLEVEFIRADGNISRMKLYETDRDYIYVDYDCEQGHWKYYLGASYQFSEIEQILSPEGLNRPNTVLKH